MPTEIEPGVWDITTRQDDNGRRYRVYLVEDDIPTLVDTGHAATVETLFDGLAEVGVEPERLLLTHGDGDHVAGADAIVDRYGVDVYAPDGEELACDRAADVRFADGDAIGDFTAVNTPGHSAHHSAFVHEPRSLAILGDAVFGSDLRGLPAGYFTLPAGVYSEDLTLADAALENLLEYDFDVGLVFHGSSVTEKAGEKLERFVAFPGKP
jgi:glyoxylase-like metal-dependent hydrolase (beta-lactamase superfamily II)